MIKLLNYFAIQKFVKKFQRNFKNSEKYTLVNFVVIVYFYCLFFIIVKFIVYDKFVSFF